MNRRGFLQSCLALSAAPAIVRADSLMRIVPREVVLLPYQQEIASLIGYGDESFSMIIARTFKEHSAEIRANVERHNALLRYMARRQ